jgi:hypothetical protein
MKKNLSSLAQDVILALHSQFDQDGDGAWSYSELNSYQEQTGDNERVNSSKELVDLFDKNKIQLREDKIDKIALMSLYELQGEEALVRDVQALLQSNVSLSSNLKNKLNRLLIPVENLAWKGEFSMKRDLSQLQLDEDLAINAASEKARKSGWVGVFDLTEKGRCNVDENVTEDEPKTTFHDNIQSEDERSSSRGEYVSLNILSPPPTLVHTPPPLSSKPAAVLASTAKLDVVVAPMASSIIESDLVKSDSSKTTDIETISLKSAVIENDLIKSDSSETTDIETIPMKSAIIESELVKSDSSKTTDIVTTTLDTDDNEKRGNECLSNVMTSEPTTTTTSTITTMSTQEDQKIVIEEVNHSYALPRPLTPPLNSLSDEQLNSTTDIMPRSVISTSLASDLPKSSSPTSIANERRLQTVKLALASAPLGIPRTGSSPPTGLSWISQADVETVITDFDILPSVFVLSEAEAGAHDWLESKAGLCALHAEESRIIREQVENGIVSTASQLFCITNAYPAGVPDSQVRKQAFETLFTYKTNEISKRLTSDPLAACDLFWEYVKDARSNKWPPPIPLSLPNEEDESYRSLPDSPGRISYPDGFESWLRWREIRRRLSARAFQSWTTGKDIERSLSKRKVGELIITSTPSGQLKAESKVNDRGISSNASGVTTDKSNATTGDMLKANIIIADLNPQDEAPDSPAHNPHPIEKFNNVDVIAAKDDNLKSLASNPVRRLSLSTEQITGNDCNTPSVKQRTAIDEDDDTLSDTEVLVNAVMEVASVLARRLAKERAQKSAEKAKVIHSPRLAESPAFLIKNNRSKSIQHTQQSQSNVIVKMNTEVQPMLSSSDINGTSQASPQAYPQVSPKVTSQSYPQASPQVNPQVYAQVNPQASPRVSPQVKPQASSQVNPEDTLLAAPSVSLQVLPSLTSSKSPPDTLRPFLPQNSLNRVLRTSPILQSIAAALGGYLQEARNEIEISDEARDAVDRTIDMEEKTRRKYQEVNLGHSLPFTDRGSAFFEVAEKTLTAQLSILSNPNSPTLEVLDQTKKLVRELKECK